VIEGKRRFTFRAPVYCGEDLVGFVAERVGALNAVEGK